MGAPLLMLTKIIHFWSRVYIESVSLENFRCFDEDGAKITLASDLTAFIGSRPVRRFGGLRARNA